MEKGVGIGIPDMMVRGVRSFSGSVRVARRYLFPGTNPPAKITLNDVE